MTERRQQDENGIVIFTVLAFMVILFVLVASFLSVGHTALECARNWQKQDKCLLAAQSAIEKAKWDIQTTFESHFTSPPLARTAVKFDWFDTHSAASIGSTGQYTAPSGEDYEGAEVSVTIHDVRESGRGMRDVVISARASIDGTEREVLELVRYELGPSRVFDYAYFINNLGWFWGGSIHANGDVRANGNFSCRYGPQINGDVIAAVNPDVGASGLVHGSWDSWGLGAYYSNAPNRARPGDPPSSAFDDTWPMGYDGAPEELECLTVLDMPYLGDLSDYEWLANREAGSVKQHNTTLVDRVYDGHGPDGTAGTPDDGTVVLVGTKTHPIEIDGPVIVRGDVIIAGTITGQGTIYAGRNIHVINNLEYDDPPEWTKPDTDPEDTAGDNSDRDLVGLAAKGNIILGDYTNSAWNVCKQYMRPGFTKAYATDASDAGNGYDSDGDPANGYEFDGDYTAVDGGQKIDASGAIAARRYYECSNEQAFLAASPSCTLTRVDAVCYTNHLYGGRTGAATWNGGIISRDEAIIFSSRIDINWDIRVGSESEEGVEIEIYLPRSLRTPATLYWREQ